MKLTDDQRKILFDKLNGLKLPPPKCAFCSKNNWSVSDTIFELREFQGGQFILGKDQSVLPVIPFVCNHCGHTIFVNAIVSGVLNPQKSEGKNE